MRPGPETLAHWTPVLLWWRPGVGIVHVLRLVSEGTSVYAVGSSCVFELISVAFALLPSSVLGFPKGLYPVGFEGRIH